MKKTKILGILSACMISMISSSGICFAEGKTTAIVSYEPDFVELAPTDVKVVIEATISKYGAIYDGDQKLNVGETIYQLRHTETKIFRIRPADGYDIDKVYYDNEEITDRLRLARSIQKDYRIEIEGKGHDALFEVIFKKLTSDEPETPVVPDKPGTPDHPSQPDHPIDPDYPETPNNPVSPEIPSQPNIDLDRPNTGDKMNLYGYGIILMTLAVINATLLVKKREDKDKN